MSNLHRHTLRLRSHTIRLSLRFTPRLAALAAGLIGLINVASALSPQIRWRGHLLLDFEPVEAVRVFHAFALPAGVALLLVAPYLAKRRIRAWRMALVLMVALGLLDLLKGLDFEETVITWAVAAVLSRSRVAFTVDHDDLTLRSAFWRVPLLGACALGVTALAAWATEGRPSWGSVVRETGDLLLWRSGPIHFHDHSILFHHRVMWLPLSVHLVELGTLLAMAYVVFRPLAAPRSLPGPSSRRAAAELVRAHGSDTLSFFKLREDKHYFFSRDGRAFVGYRTEAGVLLLSGDPVGPDDAVPVLLEEVHRFAATRGLKLGAVGASARLCPLYEAIGLKTIYLGDEAMLDLDTFSLQGRPIRKVRQSVTRLTKAGFSAELIPVSELDCETTAEVNEVLVRGREGAPERGFSMAMDAIDGAHSDQTVLVVARDEHGAIRGVLHFVPTYGRPAASLSFMRRDPGTPNGLTEFMVCSAAELLRARGVREMSLNFAAFAKWMNEPDKRIEQWLGKLISLGNRFFQIESLYRFNAKFFPRWEPRYLVYEGTFGLARASVAAMWAEGQMPKPALPRRRHDDHHGPRRAGTLTSV
ncbi:MAG TPA: phosphatidylglycerol lysyltransferase domain-containing protein [Solirubrobacteraceae bacterium]|nr:phosphatidylglycerol lysyltransferase domain-containing protein [Solirubrobacteraceae bacterium]